MKMLKDVKLVLDLKQKKEFNFSPNATKILEKFLLPLASFNYAACSWVSDLCNDAQIHSPHTPNTHKVDVLLSSVLSPFFNLNIFPMNSDLPPWLWSPCIRWHLKCNKLKSVSLPFPICFSFCDISGRDTTIHPFAEGRNWESFHTCPLSHPPFLIWVIFI